jgi:hypothetical protein
MPEVGRPMMQRMIPEQAGQAQFAALELSRRAEEIGRLRDLAPPALVSDPAPAVVDREPIQETAEEPAPPANAVEHPDEPAAPIIAAPVAPVAVAEPPAMAPVPVPPAIVAAVAPPPPTAPPPALQEDNSGKAVAVPAPADMRDTSATVEAIIAAVASPPPAAPPPTAPPPALQEDNSGKAVADPAPADTRDTSPGVEAIEAIVPGADATGSRPEAALADTVEVVPSVHLGARLNVRLPRGRARAKAAVWTKRPVRHAIRRSHRPVPLLCVP